MNRAEAEILLEPTGRKKIRATFELEMDDLYYQHILGEIETKGYCNIASYFITIRKSDESDIKSKQLNTTNSI